MSTTTPIVIIETLIEAIYDRLVYIETSLHGTIRPNKEPLPRTLAKRIADTIREIKALAGHLGLDLYDINAVDEFHAHDMGLISLGWEDDGPTDTIMTYLDAIDGLTVVGRANGAAKIPPSDIAFADVDRALGGVLSR